MIWITQKGVVASPEAARQLHAEFEETGCAMLPGFLSPQVLTPFLKQVETARFESADEVLAVDGTIFGTTLKMPRTEPTVATLHFILNTPALFERVERASGATGLRSYMGRMHRTNAGASHHIHWHDDAIEDRSVGLGINLTTQSYSGGLFQIRDPQQRIRREIGQTPAGDAFLFRIGGGWEHRLTAVECGQRTVAFGWFRTQPDWLTVTVPELRGMIAVASIEERQ